LTFIIKNLSLADIKLDKTYQSIVANVRNNLSEEKKHKTVIVTFEPAGNNLLDR